VFEWMSYSLRDPSRIYELITPARRPLVTSAGSVKQADLLPSAMLNFRRDYRKFVTLVQTNGTAIACSNHGVSQAAHSRSTVQCQLVLCDSRPQALQTTHRVNPHDFMHCHRHAQVAGSRRAGCWTAGAAGWPAGTGAVVRGLNRSTGRSD
jgi:hypothetical protein